MFFTKSFLDRENILPILIFIIHGIHTLLDDQNTHASDLAILDGLCSIGISLRERIVRFSGVASIVSSFISLPFLPKTLYKAS